MNTACLMFGINRIPGLFKLEFEGHRTIALCSKCYFFDKKNRHSSKGISAKHKKSNVGQTGTHTHRCEKHGHWAGENQGGMGGGKLSPGCLGMVLGAKN